jgi:hypothetical protein
MSDDESGRAVMDDASDQDSELSDPPSDLESDDGKLKANKGKGI